MTAHRQLSDSVRVLQPVFTTNSAFLIMYDLCVGRVTGRPGTAWRCSRCCSEAPRTAGCCGRWLPTSEAWRRSEPTRDPQLHEHTEHSTSMTSHAAPAPLWHSVKCRLVSYSLVIVGIASNHVLINRSIILYNISM